MYLVTFRRSCGCIFMFYPLSAYIIFCILHDCVPYVNMLLIQPHMLPECNKWDLICDLKHIGGFFAYGSSFYSNAKNSAELFLSSICIHYNAIIYGSSNDHISATLRTKLETLADRKHQPRQLISQNYCNFPYSNGLVQESHITTL